MEGDSKHKKDEYARNVLENYAKNYKIFLDTCSILEPAIDKFWMDIIPFLHRYQNKIIIPLRTIEELQKHERNIENINLANKAKNSLKVLQQLLTAGYVEIRGEKSDNFADNVFQVVFTKFRMTNRLLLITQDNNLAKDILALNNNRSVKAKQVRAKRIDRYGYLSDYAWNSSSIKQKNSRQDDTRDTENKIVLEKQMFRVCNKVTDIVDSELPVSHIPDEGEMVYASNGMVKLGSKVAEGGEGKIYTTNTPYVAKIYKRKNNTKRKYAKIKLMLSKKIQCEGICYPVSELYNVNKEFIGYLMPKAKGKELQKSIFIKQLFLSNFPNWKKRDTVELCITILEKIKYLHYRNIIMGDINPANILVVSQKEVYFVDTDSYQIEDFPCPVGMTNYTAPEIQGNNFSKFLRTKGNENFAVATLLFMIMLPGKPPYSQQGGGYPGDNIKNMDFSYPFGENSNKKTPDGPWRYIWSHLIYDLKKKFYNTFRQDGENSKENDRFEVDEWLSCFRNYLRLLDDGILRQQDPMSEELFPTRHKRSSKIEYVRCRLCGQEKPEDVCVDGICRECLNKEEIYRCKKCGKKIIYTNYQKYIKNVKPYEFCPECYNYGNQVKVKRYCIDCGKLIEITNNEYDFYKRKGFDLPKRCPSCRENKKNNYNNRDNRNNGTFCFISTVLCEYFGKSDDCIELNILREYRDEWLRKQSGGVELITKYYNTAPLMVSKLKASDRYEEHCQYMWQNYLQPCLKFIEQKRFETCKDKYIEMYEYLESILS